VASGITPSASSPRASRPLLTLRVLIKPADTRVITKFEDTLSPLERKQHIVGLFARTLQRLIDEGKVHLPGSARASGKEFGSQNS
jgi:ribosomal protein L9